MSEKTRIRIRRRSVYIATIVTMLAMVGGFALAAAFGVIGGTTAQNGFTASTSGTVWVGSVTVAGAPAIGTQTCVPAPYTYTTSTATDTIYLGGSVTACGTAGDFYEKFTLAPTTSVAIGKVDTFTIYSGGANGYTVSVQVTIGTVAATSLTIYVDYTTAPPGGIQTIPGSVSLFVQGN